MKGKGGDAQEEGGGEGGDWGEVEEERRIKRVSPLGAKLKQQFGTCLADILNTCSVEL